MNDSLRTNAFVRHSRETIACACIFLAARQLKVCVCMTGKCSVCIISTICADCTTSETDMVFSV